MTRVRPMTEADWTEVLALDRARYGAESWSKYFVRMAPLLFGDASFVAEREGRLIGYVLAAPEGEARSWTHYLNYCHHYSSLLWVVPRWPQRC